MSKKVIRRTVEVCDVCQREEHTYEQCLLCKRDYCLLCRSLVMGCEIQPDICKECWKEGRADVKAIIDKYATKIYELRKERDVKLKALTPKGHTMTSASERRGRV